MILSSMGMSILMAYNIFASCKKTMLQVKGSNAQNASTVTVVKTVFQTRANFVWQMLKS